MAHILSISYDQTLLRTRELLLQQLGHSVLSVEGFAQALKACVQHGKAFDLVILGHSIPHDDKVALIEEMERSCPCPVLALLRPHEGSVKGASRNIDPAEPRDLIKAVDDLLSSNESFRESKRA